MKEHVKSEHILTDFFECVFCGEIQGDKRKEEIHIIEQKISSIEAQENRKKILENFKSYSDNPELIDSGKMWNKLGLS